ncbi:SRPBCC family protein [Nocardia coubleae]|uniref:SRPBCC family protein n=1 Tax=Nocardia coubleae TaxID=356147 RepID=UPI000831798E|nr:SRPBCC family protein [Nocardia coubleae]
MTEIRSHIVIDTPADTVWKLIGDVPNIAHWMPSMIESRGDADQRTVTLADGATLIEKIVTNDAARRRLQYAVVGGDLPVTTHLGTVDVLPIAEDRSIVVYSTELEPADLADAFDSAISAGLAHLKSLLER